MCKCVFLGIVVVVVVVVLVRWASDAPAWDMTPLLPGYGAIVGIMRRALANSPEHEPDGSR